MFAFPLPIRPTLPCAAAARARCSARGAVADAEGAAAARGWHDSSFELSAGLVVIEHGALEGATLATAVAAWLQ